MELIKKLIDEQYILEMYQDNYEIGDSEDLTNDLWEQELYSGNEFNLEYETYFKLVLPEVEKIWIKNNLVSK
jgi:hypothetical protein